MIILFLIIIICSLLYYRKTVLVTTSTLVFLPTLTSGIPGVKLLYIICLFHCLLFLLHRRKYQIRSKYPKLLLIPSILTLSGYLISDLLGFTDNIYMDIVTGIVYFCYPYILWNLIKDEKSLMYYLRSLYRFFLVVGVYALIELALGNNYYADFAESHGIVEGLQGGIESRARFGILRCNSILPYSSTLGMTCSVMAFILLYLRSKKVVVLGRLDLLLVFLMPFCVLICGTRSQFVVFAICMFPFLFWSSFLKTKLSKALFCIAFIILIAAAPFFLEIIDSILDSDNAQIGSSSSMRLGQLEVCNWYFQRRPIWGHGRNFIYEDVIPDNPALYGAESVWFRLMVDYGAVGCFTYLLSVVCSILFLKKYSLVFIFVPIAFIVGKTLSIVVAIEIGFLLLNVVLLSKVSIFGENLIRMSNFKNRNLNI